MRTTSGTKENAANWGKLIKGIATRLLEESA
jgi:hypothetical protein